MNGAGRTRREWLIAAAALGVVTVVLFAVRAELDKAHVALAYLLVVLGVSSRGGRAIGVTVSVAAFFLFNFLFLPPFHTLNLADPVDWGVLGAFLLTSIVAAQLLVRARSEAASAQLRAREVERLATLGAEAINAARAEDALAAIAEVVRSTLDVAGCEIHVRGADGAPELAATGGAGAVRSEAGRLGQPGAEGILAWVSSNGRAAVELSDGSMRVAENEEGELLQFAGGVRNLVLPLEVRGRTVGLLTIAPARTFELDAPRRHFLAALSYYAALGVERIRLVREADRADALQRADETKNAVLASVSHDLRTPLTTIKALAHEIRAEGDDRAATIEEEADRLNRFVADLLDLSRIAAGGVRVQAEVNAAEDLIGAAVQRVSGALAGRRVVASLDTSEPLLLGRFDFAHSLRVLGNLLDNAVKFAPPDSTVDVRARRVDGTLEFLVSDRGPGIAPEDRDVVFQPFFRAGTADGSAGVGLGLSIAGALAAAQGGSVRYEPRDGGGSVFIFSVPAADIQELEGLGSSL